MKFNSTLIQSLDKFFHSQRISKIIKFSSSQNHLTENNLEQSSISNDPFYSVKKKNFSSVQSPCLCSSADPEMGRQETE